MRRPLIFVVLSLVAASSMALVVYSALHRRDLDVARATAQSLYVAVAARDLPIGTKIDQSDIKMARWSRDSIPPGAFTDPSGPTNRITRGGFVENEPIIADRLFGGDQSSGAMPLLIPKGMRAMSVAVDEVSDIAGFVEPHARVDVVASMALGGTSGNQPFAKIVLQNVEVLAVAQQMENGGADKPQIVRVVTLLVSPADAERLTLASHEGALRLAMRNFTDQAIVATGGAQVEQILRPEGTTITAATVPAPQRTSNAVPAPQSPVEIEIMRNGKSIENVAFVHHGRDTTGRRLHEAAPQTDLPVAAVPPDAAPADSSGADDTAPAESKAEPSSAAPTSPAPIAAATPAGIPRIAATTAQMSGLAALAGGFSTPHARTIEVP